MRKKLLVRNIVLAPVILSIMLIVLPIWIMARIGEMANTFVEWLEDKIPSWATFRLY